MGTFKMCSLSNFQIYCVVLLLTVLIMLSIKPQVFSFSLSLFPQNNCLMKCEEMAGRKE